MKHLFTDLPVQDPLSIFAILIGIILLAPYLFRLIRIPDVAAFILAGLIVGPYGLNILANDSSIEMFGKVGLIYIMFITGLELDSEKLISKKRNSIIFGLFTFSIPFILGLTVSTFVLHFKLPASLLVSIMFSTHTLVAYPAVRKLGITRDIAVLTAVGGTIITDTIVLVILSMITQSFAENSGRFQLLKVLLYFGAYLLVVFLTFPRIARWFFKNFKRDRPVHFLFLLFMVTVSSLAADLTGSETIIGAFAAGLALNRSIPKNSPLMHHVNFVGNILFIPVFLLSIGMMINTRILFQGFELWYLAGILIITAITGKWIAARISAKLLKLDTVRGNLLFGLSTSRAAATIAVILIGYEAHLVDINIFNATILVILVTCLAATFITERSGRKLSLEAEYQAEADSEKGILVPVSNPDNILQLLSVASGFNPDHAIHPIYILNIMDEDSGTRENITRIRRTLEKGILEYNNLNENFKVITRVDLNVSEGILRAAKEYMVSDIVFGYSEKETATQRIFGNIFDHLTNGLQTLYACYLNDVPERIQKVVIHLPANIEHEPALPMILKRIHGLPVTPDATFKVYCLSDNMPDKIKNFLPKKFKQNVSWNTYNGDLPEFLKGALNIFFYLRKQSASCNPRYNQFIMKMLAAYHDENYIIVVPGYE